MFAKNKGDFAEQLACDYLHNQGLKLITKNYHCRRGEIDLIMSDSDTLVFIEVRYRKQDRFGSALESVTPTKQAKIIQTAQHYLHDKRPHFQHYRFDVVAINPNSSSKFDYNWVKHAFQANN